LPRGRFFPLDGRDHPQQVPVALNPPDLGRQSLPLRGSQARIAQPVSLSLKRIICCGGDGTAEWLGQTGQLSGDISPCLGLALLVGLGRCRSISFSHS
jgi:hypothetical protein